MINESVSTKIEVNGISLNVVEEGKRNFDPVRPSLVFLHYFGASSRAWTEVIAGLRATYHCVAPDLRGYGDSDAPPSGYALRDYTDDINELLLKIEINRFVLIGHSMGGKIALAAAARRPANLDSLILLAPSPPTPEPIPEDERARLLAGYGNRAAAVATLRKITARHLPAPIFERCIKDNFRCSPLAWRAWLEDGSHEDFSFDMGRIEVPVFVVAGAMDEPLNASLLEREIVQRIAGARLMTLPDAKHLLPLEQPTKVAWLINNHCQR